MPLHRLIIVSLAALLACASFAHAGGRVGRGGSTSHRWRGKSMGLVGNLLWMVRRPRQGTTTIPGSPRARSRDQARAEALLRKPVTRGRWSKIRWSDLQRQVARRLKDPSSVDQGKLHLCMGAVSMSATARDNPLRYVELVREVYERGTFNGRRVSSRLRSAAPKSTNPLDWMMLSASRNAHGRPGYTGQPGFSLSAINLPAEMKRLLSEVTGYRRVKSFSRFLRSGSDLIPRINAQRARDGAVVLLMSMKGLRPHQGHNMHWTRLLGPIRRLPPATGIEPPVYREGLQAYLVRWQESGGAAAHKTFASAKEARAFSRMLSQPRVKMTLFDHGRRLPVHLSERAFGRQLLHVTLADR